MSLGILGRQKYSAIDLYNKKYILWPVSTRKTRLKRVGRAFFESLILAIFRRLFDGFAGAFSKNKLHSRVDFQKLENT